MSSARRAIPTGHVRTSVVCCGTAAARCVAKQQARIETCVTHVRTHAHTMVRFCRTAHTACMSGCARSCRMRSVKTYSCLSSARSKRSAVSLLLLAMLHSQAPVAAFHALSDTLLLGCVSCDRGKQPQQPASIPGKTKGNRAGGRRSPSGHRTSPAGCSREPARPSGETRNGRACWQELGPEVDKTVPGTAPEPTLGQPAHSHNGRHELQGTRGIRSSS